MFYLKLAIRNVRQSLGNFLPFALASTVMFIMNFVLATILLSPSVKKLQGGPQMAFLLGLGLIVLTVFAVILMVYSYRFLLKRRTKEFGLYHILGLKKRQIVHISLLELLLMFIITVVCGAAFGLVLAKFLYLILVNLLGGRSFDLQWSPAAALIVAAIFAAIYLLLALIGSVTIYRQSGLELLGNLSRGEKEPKSHGLLALLSVACLGGGYYLAVTVTSPLDALMKFFIAVLLVIAGTILFFLTFTIWLLKRQKKNKRYYYQPQHFITVSGMLYRMKQNALGLANITILMTMTFVTLATTAGLYSSVDNYLNSYFVRNTAINVAAPQSESVELVERVAKETGTALRHRVVYETSSSLTGAIKNGKFVSRQHLADVTTVNFMTAKTYRQLTGKTVRLRGNEAVVYTTDGKFAADQISFWGRTFTIKGRIAAIKNFPSANKSATDGLVLIVNHKAQVRPVLAAARTAKTLWGPGFETTIYADMNPQAATKLNRALSDYRVVGAAIHRVEPGKAKAADGILPYVDVYAKLHKAYVAFTGGFLFIGLVLGFTFILGTAQIIYYKQISEGEQDRRNFAILQEVGLSGGEVRRTIRSQVLLVFFLPITVAVVHFGFAFLMIRKLISLFGTTRFSTIFLASAATIAVVAAMYYLIYKQTSRAYYRIVER